MKRIASPVLVILWVLSTFGFAWSATKDTVVIAMGADATTLDPHNQQDTPTANVCLNIFEPLLQRSPDLRIEPLLATSYKLVNDTTWEFSLRRGVKFQNEEDFNAAAVKFSLERSADPKNKFRQPALQIIDRVDILDNYTVRIITKAPYVLLDKVLCAIGAILPPAYVQEKGPAYLSTNPVGTGPYKFVRWVKDDYLMLEANEKYWRGAPRIKKVIFRPVPDATTRVAGLQTQELDIIANIPPHLSRLMDWKGRSFVSKAPSARAIYVAFDTTKGGAVANKRVRQAIAQAVNMESIIKKLLDGNGILLGVNYTKEQFGYDPSIKPYAYNPERAKKLLAEAGYSQGFELVLHSPSGRYLNDKEIAEAIVGDLRKVGINASLKTYEFGTYISNLASHNLYPAYLIGWGNPLFEAYATIGPSLRTGEPFSNYSNANLDTLIKQAAITMDKRDRQKIYFKACKLIKEEVPVCCSYQQIDIYGVNERLNWKARSDERLEVFDMSFKK
jgi:peptide/nickel transport system substrate-binding protein